MNIFKKQTYCNLAEPFLMVQHFANYWPFFYHGCQFCNRLRLKQTIFFVKYKDRKCHFKTLDSWFFNKTIINY